MNDAREYLGSPSPPKSDLTIEYALEGLNYAQERDLYSSGLDLVVASANGMVDHFEDLQDDFGKRLKKIQKKHRALKKKE